jgi:hypothetical protein
VPASIRDRGDALDIRVPLRRSPVATVVIVAAILVYCGIILAKFLGRSIGQFGGFWESLDLLAGPAIVVLCLMLVTRHLTREDIMVDSGGIHHRYALGPVPMSVRRTFAFTQIQRLRALADPVGPFRQTRITVFGADGQPGHGTIAFEYGGRQFRIGSSLDVSEAQQIIDQIVDYARGRAGGSPSLESAP